MSRAEKMVVTEVHNELAKWQGLRAQLDSDDPQAILDTLEGETDLYEALLIVADKVLETEALAAGLEGHLKNLGARKSRLSKTAETLRNVILSAMETANIPTITGPLCALSRAQRAGALIVTDEEEIPADYFVAQDPKLDKKMLTAALKDGLAVPGAELSNGGISLTIRVK